MKGSTILAVGAGVGILAFGPQILKAVGATAKIADIDKNIVIKPYFGKILGFDKSGNLIILVGARMYNYTGFDIQIENIFALLDYEVPNKYDPNTADHKAWENLGLSRKFVEKAGIGNGLNNTLEIPFLIEPTTALDILLNNPNTNLRVATKFDLKGIQVSVYSYFKASDYLNIKDLATKFFTKKKTINGITEGISAVNII